MYNLFMDEYLFYFSNLDDVCMHFCKILKNLNLISFWNKGVFEKTHPPGKPGLEKIKKYTVETHHPRVKFTIWYRGFEELDKNLLFYTISKYI